MIIVTISMISTRNPIIWTVCIAVLEVLWCGGLIPSKMNALWAISINDECVVRHFHIFTTFLDLCNGYMYQHDNAPIHTARVVKSCIQSQNVGLLSWTPYSPDLNLIENVWGWLTLEIYGSGKQFSSVPELVKAIEFGWDSISLNYLASLYQSLPNRMTEVLERQGGSTHY